MVANTNTPCVFAGSMNVTTAKKKGQWTKMCHLKGKEKPEQTIVVYDKQPVGNEQKYNVVYVQSESTKPYKTLVKVNCRSSNRYGLCSIGLDYEPRYVVRQ